MASKVNKKKSVNIKGILSLTDDGIFLEIEDYAEPVKLSELIKDFEDEEVNISISHTQEL